MYGTKQLMLFYAITLVMTAPMFAMKSADEDKINRLSEFGRNIAVGSATGTAEVVVNQPLIYFKNMLQGGKPFGEILRNPRNWYRGFGVGVVSMAPTTAIQVASNEGLKTVLPHDSSRAASTRAFLAGVVSAGASTPTEMIVLHQQMHKELTARQVMQYLASQRGYGSFVRGFTPKALRDGGFGVGFLSFYPQVEKELCDRTESRLFATLGAAVVAGGGTAVATHPFDTVSVLMQRDASKQRIKSSWQAVCNVYEKDGFKGFYRGVVPRGTRVALAILIMNKVKAALTDESTERVDAE